MWRCWLTQSSLKRVLDDSMQPSTKAQHHLQACPSCYAWYQAQNTLITSLKREAQSVSTPSSTFDIAPQVLRGLQTPPSHRSTEHSLVAGLWARTAPIGLACTLAIVCAYYAWDLSHPQPRVAPQIRWMSLSADLWLQDATGRSLGEWDATLHEPLDQELTLLWSDTQETVNVLVASFVPETFRAHLNAAELPKP